MLSTPSGTVRSTSGSCTQYLRRSRCGTRRCSPQALTLATQLEAALTNRAVIDQAVGLLMSRSGAAPWEAFSSLTVLSQKENRKLAVIAKELVDDAVGRARARHHRG